MFQVISPTHAHLFLVAQVQVFWSDECRQLDVSVLASIAAPMAEVHPSSGGYGELLKCLLYSLSDDCIYLLFYDSFLLPISITSNILGRVERSGERISGRIGTMQSNHHHHHHHTHHHHHAISKQYRFFNRHVRRFLCTVRKSPITTSWLRYTWPTATQPFDSWQVSKKHLAIYCVVHDNNNN